MGRQRGRDVLEVGKLYTWNRIGVAVLAIPLSEFATAPAWKYLPAHQVFMFISETGFTYRIEPYVTVLARDTVWVLSHGQEKKLIPCNTK